MSATTIVEKQTDGQVAVAVPEGIPVTRTMSASVHQHQQPEPLRNGDSGKTQFPRYYNVGPEVNEIFASLGVKKKQGPWTRIFFLGLLSGLWVTFAGIFALVSGGGVDPALRKIVPILPKMLVALTFPVGLVFILVFGGELFTGNTMIMVVAWLNKRISIKDLLVNWTLVFTSNLIGCISMAYVFGYLSGIFADEPYNSFVVATAEKKANLTILRMFINAIPANALVCTAFFIGLSSRDMTGRIISLYLPIITFAASGWEHSVANMFFISVGMMNGANVSIAQYFTNIFFVGLGNLVGGSIVIGASEYYLYHTPAPKVKSALPRFTSDKKH